ncbi:MAG: hypothetical protein AAF745_14320 [Planctomycetota bacterium]
MARTHNPRFAISGDGDTDSFELGQVEHKIMCKFGDSVTGTVSVQTGIDEAHLIEIDSLTGSKVIFVKGPGILVFSTTSYAGVNGIQIDIGEVLP